MIKKIPLTLTFIFLILLNGCVGYKPIFSSANLEFTIDDYTLEGDEILGNKLYSRLYNLSKTKKTDKDKNIILFINISSNKSETSKDSTGKVLEYKITLNAKVEILDSISTQKILNETFISSTNYKAQSQYSETLKLENTATEDLINKMYQDLLIILAQNINT